MGQLNFSYNMFEYFSLPHLFLYIEVVQFEDLFNYPLGFLLTNFLFISHLQVIEGIVLEGNFSNKYVGEETSGTLPNFLTNYGLYEVLLIGLDLSPSIFKMKDLKPFLF